MFFKSPLSRFARCSWLIALALLLILTSCGSSPNANNQGTNTTTPRSTAVIIPTCSQTSCYPTPAAVYGGIPGIRPFIDTWNNIHLFLSFDYKIPQPAAIANHYDFVWGADPAHVSVYRSSNPKMFITYYIPFHRDNGTFSDHGDRHDLSYWKRFHPDWVLYKCDRVTPAYVEGDPNIPLDFSNPAVVSWQVQTYAQPASVNGYDGIDADNLDLQNYGEACGVYKNGSWVQLYTAEANDPQWIAGINSWLTQMQQALHNLPHPLALIPNISLSPLSPDDPQVQQLLKHVDGVLDEGGFTHYSKGYLTGTDWLQRIQFIRSVQEMHKPYYIVNQFPPPSVNSAEIQWALASYLMSKEHSAAVFISTYQGYGGDTRYNEYNAPIDSPLGEMYQEQNVYWRNYSNGRVVVNPSATHTYTVSINIPPGMNYYDLYGNHIGQTITLPPHSGMVLLHG